MSDQPQNRPHASQSNAEPSGENARARHAGDVIASQIGDNARGVAVGKNIIQIGSVRIPRVVAIILLVGMGVVAFGAAFLVYQSLPERIMPEGTFNIGVMELTTYDTNENQIKTDEAHERAMSIARYLEDQKDVLQALLPFQIEVWGPDRLARRATSQEASEYAEAVNANVLVYGTLRELPKDQWQLEPAFYLDDSAVKQAKELRGAHALGTVIEYHSGSLAATGNVNTILRTRLTALVQILQGLSHMTLGTDQGYREAIRILEEAAADTNWGAANDGTGQEVLYLFLGNAYISQATQSAGDERTDLLIQSRKAYSTAVTLNDSYARAYNGLGFSSYQMVLDTPEQCQLEVLDQIGKNFITALQLPMEAKPESGYVDYRATWGLGRVDLLKGLCGDASAIDDALLQYGSVVDTFANIDEPFDDLVDMAVSAYAESGTIRFLQHQGYVQIEKSAKKNQEQNALQVALENFEAALNLSNQSNTAESKKYIDTMLPLYLQALCIDSQPERLQQVANEFHLSSSNLAELNSMIGQTQWKECIK